MKKKLFLKLPLLCFFLREKLYGISEIVKYLRNPDPQKINSVLSLFNANIGSKSIFKRSIYLDNVYSDEESTGDFSNLKVGNNCYLGDEIYLDLAKEVVFKDNVVVSGRVSIITHADCNRSPYLRMKFPRKAAPVTIENGAWIGFGATILHGVTIGENSVVAAGSVVTDDVEMYSLYGGTPARKLKNLDS